MVNGIILTEPDIHCFRVAFVAADTVGADLGAAYHCEGECLDEDFGQV